MRVIETREQKSLETFSREFCCILRRLYCVWTPEKQAKTISKFSHFIYGYSGDQTMPGMNQ